jgi:hypothetical protein
MRGKRRGEQPEDYTHPAAESIDEALARLARQDTRLNPAGPPTSRVRVVGPSRATRDRIWTVLRWIIVLGIAWVIWRATQSGDR